VFIGGTKNNQIQLTISIARFWSISRTTFPERIVSQFTTGKANKLIPKCFLLEFSSFYFTLAVGWSQ
jgi:hypothetical protein